MKRINEFFQYILCVFFPNRCKFCGKLTTPFEDICEDCQASLPWIVGDVCSHCGSMKADCNCNGRHSHYYNEIAAPLYYKDSVKNCIRNFKFNGEKLHYRCLAKLMENTCKERYKDVTFDYVTCIPMDKKSERKRGYNQGELLAKELSAALSVEYAGDLFIKLYDTDKQHDCNEIERRGNIFGVFDINDKYCVKDKNVLIIDDVKTSGSTLSECGKMLKLNDAKSVYCLTAALVDSKIDKKKKEE